jgi:hypothetical protein
MAGAVKTWAEFTWNHPCVSCGLTGYCACLYSNEPTRPQFRPHQAPAPAKCECGSGSDAASGAHSHWCPRWVRP